MPLIFPGDADDINSIYRGWMHDLPNYFAERMMDFRASPIRPEDIAARNAAVQASNDAFMGDFVGPWDERVPPLRRIPTDGAYLPSIHDLNSFDLPDIVAGHYTKSGGFPPSGPIDPGDLYHFPVSASDGLAINDGIYHGGGYLRPSGSTWVTPPNDLIGRIARDLEPGFTSPPEGIRPGTDGFALDHIMNRPEGVEMIDTSRYRPTDPLVRLADAVAEGAVTPYESMKSYPTQKFTLEALDAQLEQSRAAFRAAMDAKAPPEVMQAIGARLYQDLGASMSHRLNLAIQPSAAQWAEWVALRGREYPRELPSDTEVSRLISEGSKGAWGPNPASPSVRAMERFLAHPLTRLGFRGLDALAVGAAVIDGMNGFNSGRDDMIRIDTSHAPPLEKMQAYNAAMAPPTSWEKVADPVGYLGHQMGAAYEDFTKPRRTDPATPLPQSRNEGMWDGLLNWTGIPLQRSGSFIY